MIAMESRPLSHIERIVVGINGMGLSPVDSDERPLGAQIGVAKGGLQHPLLTDCD